MGEGVPGDGPLFTVGSSLSLAKTVRDLNDAHRLTARIDEAPVTKLIAEHDPLKPGYLIRSGSHIHLHARNAAARGRSALP